MKTDRNQINAASRQGTQGLAATTDAGRGKESLFSRAFHRSTALPTPWSQPRSLRTVREDTSVGLSHLLYGICCRSLRKLIQQWAENPSATLLADTRPHLSKGSCLWVCRARQRHHEDLSCAGHTCYTKLASLYLRLPMTRFHFFFCLMLMGSM